MKAQKAYVKALAELEVWEAKLKQCYSPFLAKKVARLRDKVEVKKREAEGIQVKIEMK